jgi:uncharacterized membrane protein YfcA
LTIYLPIAEMTVNVFLIFGIGTAVGFISGMFGVGGGFLLTPLLIFSGIPTAVVVASQASQIAATAFSGAMSYWRKRLIDVKLGAVLTAGGVLGSVCGVLVFGLLKRIGQLDLVIGLSYVALLGIIGGLMLRESAGVLLRRSRGSSPPTLRQAGDHRWLHGLPFKMRFHQAKLYMSAIPVVALGFVIGAIGAMLGIGGGFIMVPALIYLLRVPTTLAVGVSLFQTVVTMSVASVLHATTNLAVDLVLSLLLMAGGTIGAQYGASVGQRLKAEELRAMLAVLILAVALRFLFELVSTPTAPFSITLLEGPG